MISTRGISPFVIPTISSVHILLLSLANSSSTKSLSSHRSNPHDAQKSVSKSSTLYLRIPSWTSLVGAKVTLNYQYLHIPLPGNFLSVTSNWTPNDELALQLPFGLMTKTIEDDQPGYASIQAILFGSYLLAGLTNGDWDIKTENVHSIFDWITTIPATFNSQLGSLTQDLNNRTYVLMTSNHLVTMEKLPESGTDSAIYATFRVVLTNSKSSPFKSHTDFIGWSITLGTL